MLVRHSGLRWSVVATALLISGCSRPEHDARVSTAPENAAENDGASEPAAPILRENVLDREGVIIAALHAATAAALGQDDREPQSELKGRRFSVRMRFACPAITNPARIAAYDSKGQVLRVKVQSDLTNQSLPASDLLRTGHEGAVGFILSQPWLLSAGCPAPGFAAMSSGEPSIVLAQLFTAEESRAQRPASSYELTKALKPEEAPRDGLDLVISGRLSELSDGRPIHCAARDGAPACVVAAKIDRVAVERPEGGETLGEWGTGLAPQ
jgi:hypothetical protein